MHPLSSTSNPTRHAPLAALKLVVYALVSPILLVAVLGALMCVLADFCWFRTRERLIGNPPPKGLWEF